MNVTHAQATRQELRAEDILTTDQLARAAALETARSALRSQKSLVGNDPVDPTDLLRVATWVVKGSDPVDEWMEKHPATDGTQSEADAAPSTAPASDR